MTDAIDPKEIEDFMDEKFNVSLTELIKMAKSAPSSIGEIIEELNNPENFSLSN